MKLTGYYMTAICKFGAEVRNTDFVSIRDVLALNDADGVC